MDAELTRQTRQVRGFNRFVAQRIGVLQDRFLGLDRPIGQARLLWEIGRDGTDVRDLRRRLELDSGYLSRLLRALEADGLVVVEPAPADARVRIARLTAAGAAERAVLDERSDALAAGLLTELPPAQRTRLVAAMAETERLLAVATLRFEVLDPRDARARQCLEAYGRELSERFAEGYDPTLALPAGPDELTPPAGMFLVATRADGVPLGCAGLKLRLSGGPDHTAEIKRMWVAPEARGVGLARRLLGECESRARAHGAHTLRLETNRALTEAIALYRTSGFREVPPFNNELYGDHWFAKALDAADADA